MKTSRGELGNGHFLVEESGTIRPARGVLRRCTCGSSWKCDAVLESGSDRFGLIRYDRVLVRSRFDAFYCIGDGHGPATEGVVETGGAWRDPAGMDSQV